MADSPSAQPLSPVDPSGGLRVLLTCIGRRVELARAFMRAGNSLGVPLELHGADMNWLAPGLHVVNYKHIMPPVSARDQYALNLQEIVRQHGIQMIVPLLDLELPLLAELAPTLQALGCTAVISPPEVIRICQDKFATTAWLTAAGIDTPQSLTWQQASQRSASEHKFPYYLKPRTGSAGMGNYLVRDEQELQIFGKRIREPIVQEYIEGDEYTMDVYTGFDGIPRCVVPRKRLEIRSGEVSKGIIVRDERVMDIGKRVAESLRDCRGVITVQCIASDDGRLRVIEINPRFGGGAPLSIHAGADFPRWLLMELTGQTPAIRFDHFDDDVAMLRYDDSVFVPKASALFGVRRTDHGNSERMDTRPRH